MYLYIVRYLLTNLIFINVLYFDTYMRIFLIIFALISCISINAQQYWLPVNSPASHKIMKAQFLDTVYGWACGDSGTIVHTSNSGANWVLQQNWTNEFPIDDIFFINRNLGWAISNDFFFQGTILLRTTNGGSNWTNSRYPDSSLVFNTIYFLDSATGFMSGASGLIYKTTNAGNNWFNCYIDSSYCAFLYLMPKKNFYFVNSMVGYACGGQIDIQGMVWRTTNGGQHWYTYCVTAEPLYDIKAVSSSKIIATGGDLEYGLSMAISTDAGLSWNYRVTPLPGRGLSLGFRTPAELWVPLNFVPAYGVNLDSGNLSADWTMIPAEGVETVNSVIFMSPTFGWSFGTGGTIFKYNSSIIGINGNEQENIPGDFILEQNYPNPFNPVTTIGYELKRGGLVNISVYNITGELTEILQKSYQPPGYHSINWNASGHSSGVYFCRLSAGSNRKTIKMLLVK